MQLLAILLDRIGATVADALQATADYLITPDREHLLGNTRLAGEVQLPIGTPGDFLAWFRGQV